jgi:hypothetical protein
MEILLLGVAPLHESGNQTSAKVERLRGASLPKPNLPEELLWTSNLPRRSSKVAEAGVLNSLYTCPVSVLACWRVCKTLLWCLWLVAGGDQLVNAI